MAASAGASLYVVHAWSPLGESVLACPVRGLGRDRLAALRHRARTERLRRVEALLEDEELSWPACVIVEAGRPGPVIRRVAQRVRADLVVMGGVQRSALGPWGLAPMSDALAGRPDYSVLLVRGARDGTTEDPPPPLVGGPSA